jgi:hypothetical protein
VTDQFDVASAVDALRGFAARADVLASATEEMFDSVIWTVDGDNTRRLEHLSHMIAATSEAARAAATSDRAIDALRWLERAAHLTAAPERSARPAFDESVNEGGPTQVHERPARSSDDPSRDRVASEEPPFDIAREVNGLRWFIARASSLVRALEGSFERDSWEDILGEDRRRMEELSHLVGAAVEALLAATNAGDKLAAQMAKSANDRLAAALAQHPAGA